MFRRGEPRNRSSTAAERVAVDTPCEREALRQAPRVRRGAPRGDARARRKSGGARPLARRRTRARCRAGVGQAVEVHRTRTTGPRRFKGTTGRAGFVADLRRPDGGALPPEPVPPGVRASGERAASRSPVPGEAGAGGVITKSIGEGPRPGYPEPDGRDLRPVGDAERDGPPQSRGSTNTPERSRSRGAPGRRSSGRSSRARTRSSHGSSERIEATGVGAIELNLSCPHAEGFGTEVGSDPADVERDRARRRPTGPRPGHRQDHPQHVRPRRARAGGGAGRRRGDQRDQHRPRTGHRRRRCGGRSSPTAWAVSAGPRSSRSVSRASGRSTGG